MAVPPFVCSQKHMSSCQVKAKCFMKQKIPAKRRGLVLFSGSFSLGHVAVQVVNDIPEQLLLQCLIVYLMPGTVVQGDGDIL